MACSRELLLERLAVSLAAVSHGLDGAELTAQPAVLFLQPLDLLQYKRRQSAGPEAISQRDRTQPVHEAERNQSAIPIQVFFSGFFQVGKGKM